MEDCIIADWYGKQLKLYPSQCQQCGKTRHYPLAESKKRKYCSRACVTAWLKERCLVQLECAYCNETFERTKSTLRNSKSGLYFCCRKHKDLAQRINGIIAPAHYGTSENSTRAYRRISKDAHGTACAVCGYYDNICSGIVDIHHIDSDKTKIMPYMSRIYNSWV